MNASQPIGIFDSGIGGLTVTQAVVQALPQENIIYFGDTAHLPYGDKSAAAIQAYSVRIAEFLLQRRCKIILIACHTASSTAYDLVKEYVGDKAIVINVIDPMIHYLSEHYANKKVGLIGTKQTIHSNIYGKKIDALNAGIVLSAHATPLLVNAIEEGFINHPIINELLKEYLLHPTLQEIDALILGCTHYPIIKENIKTFFAPQVEIIDSSTLVTTAVKTRLIHENLLNTEGKGDKQFLASDYTEAFARCAKLFFGENITLTHYPLWSS
ncbi:MAG: glutamate racemase [Gammaproteobacteria bacterium]